MLTFKEFLIEGHTGGSAKGRELFKAHLKDGWTHIRTNGSHRIIHKPGKGNYTFSLGDHENVGPSMVNRVCKATGLNPAKINEEIETE
jgi:predicted RNA binding protein YcfA (HicA-like mRNA interferase family)